MKHSHPSRCRVIYNRIDMPEGLRQARRPFFARASGRRFEVEVAAEDTAELSIYDEIGYFGVSAADVRSALDGVTQANIRLRLNSPGGDVFDGIAIHNDLVAHPAQVTVEVVGLAASAASVIAMAGDRIEVAEAGFLMIHNAWALAIGDRREMTEMAGVLGQIDEALAGVYARRSGLARDAVAGLMDAETWLAGPAAVEQGFADAVIEAPEAEAKAALFDLSTFRNTPAGLRAQAPAAPSTTRDLERSLRDAGWSRSAAKAIASRAAADDAPPRDAGIVDAETRAAFGRVLETLRR
ncbi:MAG: head maturation protease, ClpP-related [Acetobacterales bacterium]